MTLDMTFQKESTTRQVLDTKEKIQTNEDNRSLHEEIEQQKNSFQAESTIGRETSFFHPCDS